MTSLMIDRNLLDLVVAKRTVDSYKKLFAFILNNTSITSLSIEILVWLPTLVGALGSVARGLTPCTYKLLVIRLGGAFTHGPGCSPFWETFGHPVEPIISYASPTAEEGLLTVSVPSKFWMDPRRIEEILGMSRGDQQRGALQVEFGEMPDVVLRRRGGVCTGFLWDREQERHQKKRISMHLSMMHHHVSGVCMYV